jgi:hypothetical protein
MQLVSLFRGGEKLAMGKREGNFVTLRDLRNEAGNDACRFFYLLRSHDQALDFDLELAKSRLERQPGVLRADGARASLVGDEAARREGPYLRPGAADSDVADECARTGGDHVGLEVSGSHRAVGAQSRPAFAGALSARPC